MNTINQHQQNRRQRGKERAEKFFEFQNAITMFLVDQGLNKRLYSDYHWTADYQDHPFLYKAIARLVPINSPAEQLPSLFLQISFQQFQAVLSSFEFEKEEDVVTDTPPTIISNRVDVSVAFSEARKEALEREHRKIFDAAEKKLLDEIAPIELTVYEFEGRDEVLVTAERDMSAALNKGDLFESVKIGDSRKNVVYDPTFRGYLNSRKKKDVFWLSKRLFPSHFVNEEFFQTKILTRLGRITSVSRKFISARKKGSIQYLVYAPPASGKTTFNNYVGGLFHDTDDLYDWKTSGRYVLTNMHHLIPHSNISIAVLPCESQFMLRCRSRNLDPESSWYDDVIRSCRSADLIIYTNVLVPVYHQLIFWFLHEGHKCLWDDAHSLQAMID